MAAIFEHLRIRQYYGAQDYLDMLRKLLPTGPIWGFSQRLTGEVLQDVPTGHPGTPLQSTVPPGNVLQNVVYDPGRIAGSTLGRLLSCFAEELGRIEARVADMWAERFPGLSTELLEDWETALGLPSTGAVAVRQAVAHAKLYGENRTATKQYFIDTAAALGYLVTVQEDTLAAEPAVAGVAIAGRNRAGGWGAHAVLLITVVSGSGDLATMKTEIEKRKPAHVVIVWQ